MRNTKSVYVVKYTVYTLLMLILYVVQTVPGLFQIYGAKPIWVIPAAVALAMFEGEFVGGVYGAVAGLLCDMGSFTLFGFNGFLICLCGIATGLLIIYLLRNNLFGCLLLVFLIMLVRGSLDFLFSFGMWGYEGVWSIYLFHTLPVVAYTTLITPLVYFFVRRLHNRFELALKR